MKASELLRLQLEGRPNAGVLGRIADVIDTNEPLLISADNSLQRIESSYFMIGENRMVVDHTKIGFDYGTIAEPLASMTPPREQIAGYFGIADHTLEEVSAVIFQHGRDPKLAGIVRGGNIGIANMMLAGLVTRTIYEMSESSSPIMMSINLDAPMRINPLNIDLDANGVKFEGMQRLGWNHVSGVSTAEGCAISIDRHSLIRLSA